ncbi:MAG: hypothetical protein P8Z00_09555 [Anaerolineales bacterium]
MSSTLTPSTLSTLANAALADWLAWISALLLLFFLLQKVLISSSAHSRLATFSRLLDIAIFPLLIAFILTVAVRIAGQLH